MNNITVGDYVQIHGTDPKVEGLCAQVYRVENGVVWAMLLYRNQFLVFTDNVVIKDGEYTKVDLKNFDVTVACTGVVSGVLATDPEQAKQVVDRLITRNSVVWSDDFPATDAQETDADDCDENCTRTMNEKEENKMTMEQRLIDANALMDEFDPDDKTEFDTVGVRNYISSAPTVDAVLVVHGEWKYDCEIREYCCTNCEKCWKNDDDYERTPYCPICGAKMDGD